MDNFKNINKISSYQVILLVIIYRVIIAFTYLPIMNTPPGNQDIWITLLLSIPYTIILGLPMLYLSNKFNDLTIIEYTEKILGKVIGKIIGLYYTGFLLMFCIVIVATLVEILNTTMFIETPTWATTIIMLLTCIYISYKGLEPIARGAEIFVPFILGVILLFMVLGYNNYDFTVLLPVLRDSTFKELNIGALDRSIKFSDIIILAMITPNLKRKKDLNKIYIKSIIYSVIIVLLLAITTQAALGIEYAKHTIFPFFTFNRLIDLFDFIQRIDVLSVVAWITGNVGKIAGYLYFTTVAFSQTINRQKNQPYIIPIAIIILIATVLIKDRRSLLGIGEVLQGTILVTSTITIFVIPLFTLIVYFFRRKSLK
ncbi:MAG: endospore germination permease [Tissierellia bacterium]|nr:endospore germination permease [Tissierellia bacterium]